MTEQNQNRPDAEEMIAGSADAAQRPHRPADDKEEIYFEGSPMLRGELGRMLLSILIAMALVGLAAGAHHFMASGLPWWGWLVAVVLAILIVAVPVLIIRATRYRISNYRIDYERGILSKKIDTLELWHVEDISFEQSLLDRILGVGTITIMSGDETTPNLRLHGLPSPRPIFESVKQRIIAVKRQRGVIKMDLG